MTDRIDPGPGTAESATAPLPGDMRLGAGREVALACPPLWDRLAPVGEVRGIRWPIAEFRRDVADVSGLREDEVSSGVTIMSATCSAPTYQRGKEMIPCGLRLDADGTHPGDHCGEFGYCSKYLNGHVLIRDERDHRQRACACGAGTFEDVPFGFARCCVEAGATP